MGLLFKAWGWWINWWLTGWVSWGLTWWVCRGSDIWIVRLLSIATVHLRLLTSHRIFSLKPRRNWLAFRWSSLWVLGRILWGIGRRLSLWIDPIVRWVLRRRVRRRLLTFWKNSWWVGNFWLPVLLHIDSFFNLFSVLLLDFNFMDFLNTFVTFFFIVFCV